MYATPDDEVIARMLHLPPDKDKLLSENDFRESNFVWQSMKSTTGWSMMSWFRSARIQICIHMSSSISPSRMAEGHSMPSTPGG